jgi:muramidase (phage lysozyme)
MKKIAITLTAGALAYGAWLLYQDSQEPSQDTTQDGGSFDSVGDTFSTAGQGAATFFDSMTGGILKISDMAKVTTAHVASANVQAFLRVIRTGEGTADAAGYRRIFGGQTFSSFSDHPRIKVTKGGYTSTAAGAYQALSSTWDETRRVMGLSDFSPASQDLFAVGRIAARGALDDVLMGRFEKAVRKCANEWASLPFSPYGQPTITFTRAEGVYQDAGGYVATA